MPLQLAFWISIGSEPGLVRYHTMRAAALRTRRVRCSSAGVVGCSRVVPGRACGATFPLDPFGRKLPCPAELPEDQVKAKADDLSLLAAPDFNHAVEPGNCMPIDA